MTLDSIGPMGPSVACCALVDAVLAGEEPVLPKPATLSGLRLAVPKAVVLDALDDHVGKDFERALSLLSHAGARIAETALAPFDEMNEINRPGGLSPMEAFYVHQERLERDGERYDQRVRWRIQGGAKATAVDYLWTLDRRRDWMARVSAEVQEYDAFVMPTVACIAPPIAPLLEDDTAYRHTNARVLRNTNLINFLDGCALSIPMHRSAQAPTGLMLCGLHGWDRRIFAIGMAIESALAQDRGVPR
jgi:aspartyl-tRNA(Asn)/glutamyl-tRNA(Gln) amidotransferase subunit A